MSAPVIRPWQWQDHPTRWAPGDQFVKIGYGIMYRGWYGWSCWLANTTTALWPCVPDADVDEWVMCGRAVPLVEHGNPIAGRP